MRLNEFVNRKAFHVTPSSNVENILKTGLHPQVGDRTANANDPAGIYLFPTMAELEDAIYGWLGDEFPEDEELSVLEVRVPDDATTVEGAEYEIIVTSHIPPTNIRLLDIEI